MLKIFNVTLILRACLVILYDVNIYSARSSGEFNKRKSQITFKFFGKPQKPDRPLATATLVDVFLHPFVPTVRYGFMARIERRRRNSRNLLLVVHAQHEMFCRVLSLFCDQPSNDGRRVSNTLAGVKVRITAGLADLGGGITAYSARFHLPVLVSNGSSAFPCVSQVCSLGSVSSHSRSYAHAAHAKCWNNTWTWSAETSPSKGKPSSGSRTSGHWKVSVYFCLVAHTTPKSGTNRPFSGPTRVIFGP